MAARMDLRNCSNRSVASGSGWQGVGAAERFLGLQRPRRAASAGQPLTGIGGSLRLLGTSRHWRSRYPRTFRQDVGSLFEAREQLREGDREGLRDFDEIGEAEIGFTAFNGAHERPVDATMIGERLLRVPSLQPMLANSPSQRYQDILHSHESGSMLVFESTAIA